MPNKLQTGQYGQQVANVSHKVTLSAFQTGGIRTASGYENPQPLVPALSATLGCLVQSITWYSIKVGMTLQNAFWKLCALTVPVDLSNVTVSSLHFSTLFVWPKYPV